MQNLSGITPVGVSLLILPDAVEQTTESGIVISSNTEHAREELRQTDGVVIALGSKAYFDEDARCKVGDRVIMAAYSGMIRKGKDGRNYRLILDDDVKAILEKE
jgi:co-chaperonin GroES (HSP10)